MNGLYVYEYEPVNETLDQLAYLEEPSKKHPIDVSLDHLSQSDRDLVGHEEEHSQATLDDTEMLEYEEGSSHDNLDYLEEEPSNDPLDYLYSDESHESQEYYDEYLEYDVIGNETVSTNESAEILPSALPLVGGEERFLNGVGANFMEQGEN